MLCFTAEALRHGYIARPVRGRSNTEHRLTAAIFVDLQDGKGTIL